MANRLFRLLCQRAPGVSTEHRQSVNLYAERPPWDASCSLLELLSSPSLLLRPAPVVLLPPPAARPSTRAACLHRGTCCCSSPECPCARPTAPAREAGRSIPAWCVRCEWPVVLPCAERPRRCPPCPPLFPCDHLHPTHLLPAVEWWRGRLFSARRSWLGAATGSKGSDFSSQPRRAGDR